MDDILVGCRYTLDVVALEQMRHGFARYDQSELPSKIVGVLYAAVATACAKRRHLVSAVAREEHAAMHKAVKARASENIDTGPDQFKARMAEHALEPRHHAFWLAFLDRICAGPELQIDAQDTFRLAMHQGGMAGMKRW